jgi:hypothetical protein
MWGYMVLFRVCTEKENGFAHVLFSPYMDFLLPVRGMPEK